jgi:hypothetical protein
MATVLPLRSTQCDDRYGEHFTIVRVQHITGAASDIPVDDSAVSACELPDDITASAGLAKETSTSAGVTIRNQTSGASGLGFDWVAGDGTKQVTIASGAATGTYTIVIRHLGSAAGSRGSSYAAALNA